jgi:hypothetical protein
MNKEAKWLANRMQELFPNESMPMKAKIAGLVWEYKIILLNKDEASSYEKKSIEEEFWADPCWEKPPNI